MRHPGEVADHRHLAPHDVVGDDVGRRAGYPIRPSAWPISGSIRSDREAVMIREVGLVCGAAQGMPPSMICSPMPSATTRSRDLGAEPSPEPVGLRTAEDQQVAAFDPSMADRDLRPPDVGDDAFHDVDARPVGPVVDELVRIKAGDDLGVTREMVGGRCPCRAGADPSIEGHDQDGRCQTAEVVDGVERHGMQARPYCARPGGKGPGRPMLRARWAKLANPP